MGGFFDSSQQSLDVDSPHIVATLLLAVGVAPGLRARRAARVGAGARARAPRMGPERELVADDSDGGLYNEDCSDDAEGATLGRY